MTLSKQESELREQLVACARQLESSGLSAGKSGNLSARCGDTVLITPSAVAYTLLTPAHIVALDPNGKPQPHQSFEPSSEWRFHCDLYQHRPDISGIVHAHPNACTALACTQRNIPAFHYMVAIAGGDHIPIADYALFGSAELSTNIVQVIGQLNACLLANHGMLALGKDLHSAFNLAVEVEALAQQYCLALQLGDVHLLSNEEMEAVQERFKNYGQRC